MNVFYNINNQNTLILSQLFYQYNCQNIKLNRLQQLQFMSDMNLIMKINDYGSLQKEDPKSISLLSNCGASDSINEQGLSQELLPPGNCATNNYRHTCPLRQLWVLKYKNLWWNMKNKAFKASLLCLFILLSVDLAIGNLETNN